MNKEVVYSSPAKVILSGEHAVVYGKPGLVCAIDKRITVHIAPASQMSSDLPFLPSVDAKVRSFLKEKKAEIHEHSYTCTITSDIPVSRGLGSSAALAVSLSAALLEFYTGTEWGSEMINQCAYLLEQYFHKNPSGVDNSASVFGGLLYYRKEFEFLKTISSLTLKIPQKIGSRLYLIDSGKPEESTAEMVLGVGKRYNATPKKSEKILNDIEKVTKRMVVSLGAEDGALFADCIRNNELLLEELGVVSPNAKSLLLGLTRFGTGKITGAGGAKKGAGYILFYAEDPDRFMQYATQSKLPVIKFHPSYQGVHKENV